MVIEQHPTASPQRLTMRGAALLCLVITVSGLWGCEKLTSTFRRAPMPDMGPRLANSVKLTFDPSLTNLKMQYTDGCDSPHELSVGKKSNPSDRRGCSKLSGSHRHRWNRRADPARHGNPGDAPALEPQTLGRNLYDRVPADMTLETLLTFKDAAGKELGQQTISIAHNQRLILEPTQTPMRLRQYRRICA